MEGGYIGQAMDWCVDERKWEKEIEGNGRREKLWEKTNFKIFQI